MLAVPVHLAESPRWSPCTVQGAQLLPDEGMLCGPKGQSICFKSLSVVASKRDQHRSRHAPECRCRLCSASKAVGVRLCVRRIVYSSYRYEVGLCRADAADHESSPLALTNTSEQDVESDHEIGI